MIEFDKVWAKNQMFLLTELIRLKVYWKFLQQSYVRKRYQISDLMLNAYYRVMEQELPVQRYRRVMKGKVQKSLHLPQASLKR